MNIREAVKDKENYADIVTWFRSMEELDVDRLELLEDTIESMSEEIFEHYIALCGIMKRQLQRIRQACRESGAESVFPEAAVRVRLGDVVMRACAQKVVLPEKYEELAESLK